MNLTQIVYSNDLAPTGELCGIFISRTCAFDENTVLNSSEANTHIKKKHKHKLRYERKSRMKPGKEPHAAREPRVGQAWSSHWPETVVSPHQGPGEYSSLVIGQRQLSVLIKAQVNTVV